MDSEKKTRIKVETTVKLPVESVWNLWTNPEHITKWNFASTDWHAPKAENDLRAGGKFVTRMEAKDGSIGFDFGGVYDGIQTHALIAYTMDDGRKATVTFVPKDQETHLIETFDAENENPIELQQAGWKAILNNFKAYAESH